MPDQQSRQRAFWKGCLFLFCIVTAAYLLIVGIEELIYKSVQGSGWVTYTLRNSPLEDDQIGAVFADEKGNVWIGTSKGLYVLFTDRRTWTVYTEWNSGLENGNIWAVTADKSGKTWVGTFNGLYAVDPSGQWTTYIKPGEDRNWIIQALVVDPQNRVWAGTNRGLIAFNPNGTNIFYTKDNSALQSNDVTALAVDRLGRIWIGAYMVNMVDQEGYWTTYQAPQNGMGTSLPIWVDHEDRVWLGTALGLYTLEPDHEQVNFEAFRKILLSSSNINIGTIAADKQNRLWIGAGNDLVVIQPNGNTRIYNSSNSDLHERVRALAIDGNGNLWVGTQHGLSMIDLQKGLPKTTSARWSRARNILLNPIKSISALGMLLIFPMFFSGWGIVYSIFLLLVPLSLIGLLRGRRHPYSAPIYYGSILVLILALIGLWLIWSLLALHWF